MAWGVDLGFRICSTKTAPMYSLLDYRRVVNSVDVVKCNCRGRYLDIVAFNFVSEAEAVHWFMRLHCDRFHVL